MVLIAAVGINVSQLRSSATASGHDRAVVRAERLTHPAANATAVALHFHVQRLAAGPDFVEIEQALAVCRALVQKLDPRKIVQMPMFARHHEAGRDH